jgi:hypothetical protein
MLSALFRSYFLQEINHQSRGVAIGGAWGVTPLLLLKFTYDTPLLVLEILSFLNKVIEKKMQISSYGPASVKLKACLNQIGQSLKNLLILSTIQKRRESRSFS